MLPNTDIVAKHYRGIFEHISKDSLSLDCSTIDPVGSKDLSLEAQKKGLTLVDAPVSGGVTGAQNATLAFMVGAPNEAVFDVLPYYFREQKRSYPQWERIFLIVRHMEEVKWPKLVITWL